MLFKTLLLLCEYQSNMFHEDACIEGTSTEMIEKCSFDFIHTVYIFKHKCLKY